MKIQSSFEMSVYQNSENVLDGSLALYWSQIHPKLADVYIQKHRFPLEITSSFIRFEQME